MRANRNTFEVTNDEKKTTHYRVIYEFAKKITINSHHSFNHSLTRRETDKRCDREHTKIIITTHVYVNIQKIRRRRR